MLRGLRVTVEVTVVGIAIALVLGLVLAMLRRSHRRAIRWPVGHMVEFIRSTPLLVQLFFIFYVLPDYDIRLSGWSTIVNGLALHYACSTSETYRAGIASVQIGRASCRAGGGQYGKTLVVDVYVIKK